MAMSERMERRLVVDPLEMRIQQGLPGEGLTAHVNGGMQEASKHCRGLLHDQTFT